MIVITKLLLMEAVEAITADKTQYERESSTLDQHKLRCNKLNGVAR
jgi:hypothetical protein